ncbi:PE-PPE domain-containing protein [Mycolicibacterium sp.]|uniref:PE-PPE domain-containing protein n=1 Tax=Mycolicibacterium sp. TaxID=2320850 RepID=UPI0037C98F53
MRRFVRSSAVVVLSLASTVALIGTQAMAPLVLLTATALIMGGTGHSLGTPQDSQEFIDSYTADANNDYIVLTGFCGAESCTPTAVATPEEFMPVSGTMPFDQSVAQGTTNLDQAIKAQPAGTEMVVFGYSQSARIASIEKANLAAEGSTLPVAFVLIGNPNRPNGGILSRFEGLEIPIMGITFDGPTPTDTDFKTVDVTRQYDGWSDFPLNPLNPFATANAVAGIHYLHSDYQSVGLGNAVYQGSYGDTQYYLIPSNRLPLLMPLAEAGVPSPVLAVADAPLRVLVETGYDRTVSPGEPTKAALLYFPNPAQTGVNFIIAIPTGLDDGADEAANIRPFGTPPLDQRSPYGVGGPPVNTGDFDATGAPVATTPAAVAPSAQPPAAKPTAPTLPFGPQAVAPQRSNPPIAPSVAAPKAEAPAAPVNAAPKHDLPIPWARPAEGVPTQMPPAEKLEMPTQAPIPARVVDRVPVDLPEPVVDPPDIPEVLPAPRVEQAPVVPDLPWPAAPPPVLAPPPMPVLPALPAPPPMPALPNFGGFRLPF